jgi:hypothetical protein
MNDLRRQLQRIADLYKKTAPADQIDRQRYEFVLAHGQDFKSGPLPSRFETGRPKKCYGNAVELALREPTLFYAEGFAMSTRMPIPHAWCVDREGNVYDPTLEKPEDYQFFGVRLISEAVRELMEGELGYYESAIDFLTRNPGRLTEFLATDDEI